MKKIIGCLSFLPALLIAAICLPVFANPRPHIYQKWVDEDVHWIITGEERAQFDALSTNGERDQFVERFWERRNPTPGDSINVFKQEHYRRIAFSNINFDAKNLPGWKSDRGHAYIVYGPPTRIDVREASGSDSPSEVWHYQTLHIELTFEDHCKCGEFPQKR